MHDCDECDKPEGGDHPRHANGKTYYLCAYCDRITPEYR